MIRNKYNSSSFVFLVTCCYLCCIQTIISSTHLNLAVCEVMVSFLPPVTHGCKLPEWISKITNYLESKLVTGRLNAENTETVIRVVNKILIADEG